MHKMMHEKHKRQEQIKADQAALERIDETIRTNIQPCLVSNPCVPWNSQHFFACIRVYLGLLWRQPRLPGGSP